jgi:chemotaxis protein MotB
MDAEDENTVERRREVIIVRRGGGDDLAAHKGGAWKIAYADFVTAMMAFFLVMWLINSANEATKARVASYFNPIKMTDATPSGRGINNQEQTKRADDKTKQKGSGSDAKASGDAAQAGEKETAEKGSTTREENMMAHPFKSLDSISEQGSGQPSGRTVEITNQKSGDPFDPQVWEALRNGDRDDKVASAKREEFAAKAVSAASEEQSESNGENPQSKKPFKSVEELKLALEAIQRRLGASGDFKFDVKRTDEGVLIVLEDGAAESMFRIGSAEPNPVLVSFIGSIGNLLEQQQGSVIVRGHTDARKFQTVKFDNWQLSTARAHMASYMLMRGGLSESRIQKIEGYGAAVLLDTDDPLSEINRRVEFVLSPERK